MSNNIDTLDHTEQARHQIRVQAGRDPLADTYSITDVNTDGKVANRNYVWDTGTLQWVAMASNNTASIQYDEMVLSYNGSNQLTGVVYKLGGTTVSTLTLTYTGDNLTGVTRT